MQTHLESRPGERSLWNSMFEELAITRLRDHVRTTFVYFDFFGITAGIMMTVGVLIASLVQAARPCPQKGAV